MQGISIRRGAISTDRKSHLAGHPNAADRRLAASTCAHATICENSCSGSQEEALGHKKVDAINRNIIVKCVVNFNPSSQKSGLTNHHYSFSYSNYI